MGLAEAMVLSTSIVVTMAKIWQHLVHVYKSKDMMSKMPTLTRFYSLSMKKGESMEHFVGQFKAARLKLAQSDTKFTKFGVEPKCHAAVT